MEPRESWAALAAGGVAGVCVDLILFPLDTVKTRLQSPQGFRKAGGFRGIYAGVPSAAIGSFPNAAAFFITYENVKSVLHHGSTSYLTPATHMVAASLGEVIPFSLVQFPLWESLKDLWSWKQGHVVDSWQSAVCGAFAACSQVLSHGWQPSAWEASSSWGHTRRLTSCCSDPAWPVLPVAAEGLEKPPSWRRSRPANAAFLLPPLRRAAAAVQQAERRFRC
ncbi:mitochondrial S-adenosylmethionine carrier protein isoform X8 [Phalacrocorax carbo]|uniref:mitochondrial S-adenosylmethionine carrier protein isoform X8 n=1 Tax=Phalacrocorax carbo TaxID=9209 RepID=UPI003119F5D6